MATPYSTTAVRLVSAGVAAATAFVLGVPPVNDLLVRDRVPNDLRALAFDLAYPPPAPPTWPPAAPTPPPDPTP